MKLNTKYIAEIIGTFGLTSAVILSLTTQSAVATVAVAGLTLGLFVYSIGHISGAHINPAVTIGAWSIKKIHSRDATFYIISQFIGALLALGFLANSNIIVEPLYVSESLGVIVAELIGMFFFTFGIASVVYGKTPATMSGLVVGGSLVLGLTFALGLGSNGVLNPAVALGIGSLGLSYIVGPIAGSILGMQAYRMVAEEK